MSATKHERERSVTPRGRKPEVGRLVVVAGPCVGRRFEVAGSCRIGRSFESNIIIDDSEVSREHAHIDRGPSGDFSITDSKSSNGTFVNGVEVDGTVKLRFGDKLRLGKRVSMLFVAHEPLEEQLFQRQRLETLGRITAGVVHDFNNMLATVLANLEYLTELAPDARAGVDADECREDALVATKLAAELARRLLSFARTEPGGHDAVDLSFVCHEITKLLRRATPASIVIESVIEPAIGVLGNAAELHQVLMNLCLNARDALVDGGTITVRAAMADDIELKRAGVAGPCAVVTVKDDGVGMDGRTRERIFEPFFTTKRDSGGIGLGLATVLEVVTIHGGKIKVESEPNQGTQMSVFLPTLTVAKQRAKTMLGPVIKTDGWGERVVLLIDDEAVFRRSIARVLRHKGLQVLEAPDGESGLQMFYDQETAPDLVLLDLELPKMTGDEVLQRMLDDKAGARVVCTSGDYDPDRVSALLSAGALAFLPKPISIEVLYDEVTRVFELGERVEEDVTRRNALASE